MEETDKLKREAQRVKLSDTQTPLRKRTKTNGVPAVLSNVTCPASSNLQEFKLYFEAALGDGDWVSALKSDAGPWMGDQLVVLSLFDGLGGIWQALTKLGIPFSGYSSEVLEPAIQVVKARHPHVKHLGDVRKLEMSAIAEKVDLVVGGFPCQDLSVMGKKEGLHGRKSKLFFELLRVLQIFKPKWFLVENVASMSWIDREEITRHLKVLPMEIDSQEITASKRRRLYWTNIPHPPRLPRLRDHPSTSLQSCLEDALALEQKCGVVLCSNNHSGNSSRLELVLENTTKELRYIKQTEVEVLMGYPKNYTDVLVRETKKLTVAQAGEVVGSSVTPKVVEPELSPVQSPSTRQLRRNRMTRAFFEPQVWEKPTRQESLKGSDRWFLLGNTFSVQVIAYLTSPLLKSAVRPQGKRVDVVGSVKEEELSAMEPGEVWACFNENGRPNWYALIKSRTGDRFSAIPDAGNKRIATKLPLKIEMQYMEMTPAYVQHEPDEWNPQRGAGLLKLRPLTDFQDSWLGFSHRVTSYVKFEDSYFVYPGNDEVWAVFHAESLSRYFVYVLGSTISCEKLEADKPGQEGFYARCLLLQKTAEHEVYLKTSTELEFTDLQPFCFRMPYHFKNEANSFKVEVSGAKGRKSMWEDRASTPGYKWKGPWKGKKGRGIPDDDDGTDDDLAEEINDYANGGTGMKVFARDEVMELKTVEDANDIETGSGQGSGVFTSET